jgi:hypothetical protein
MDVEGVATKIHTACPSIIPSHLSSDHTWRLQGLNPGKAIAKIKQNIANGAAAGNVGSGAELV